MRSTARAFYSRLVKFVLSYFGRNPSLANIYYGLLSSRFTREHRAVMQGRLRYERDLSSQRGSQALLRRNIHRIEKGLIMRPFRPIFGLEYIGETVQAFSKRARHRDEFPGELSWAQAVLDRYFDAAAGDERLSQWEMIYRESRLPVSTAFPCAPYLRPLEPESPVSWESLMALSIKRRSVRWFLDRRVPRALVEKAMLVAIQSPSACNRQPFVFRAFDKPARVRELSAIPMGTAGYGDLIPLLIVVVGQMRNYPEERDRHLIYIDGALAAMSFALAAETLGLSTCMINWPDIEEKESEIAERMGLEPDERPVMLIAVGFPDTEAPVPASVKRELRELLVFEEE